MSKIFEIIASRNNEARKVASLIESWHKLAEDTKFLREELKHLMMICLRAKGEMTDCNEGVESLMYYIDGLDRDQIIRKAISECSIAETELKKLLDRFSRKTLNIAVAGVGRCGKSTALKSIIGVPQEDNAIIPSGNGPAVTAGKSVIYCVVDEKEERTEVEYHTIESFLNGIVNPLLHSISLGNRTCTTLEQFECLDYELLREEVAANGRMAEATVKALKMSPPENGDEEEWQRRIASAQAYAGGFKLYLERLNDLKRIMSAFPFFREMLTGKTETIAIRDTSRYVSYPKDGSPAICYAVRNCRIYSRFPNNEVAELQLTDLPGLGTGSESERKCFFDGFDYTVDLALAVRRPEGLFQNFTTDDDIAVLNVLGAVFGEEHLHECMVLFQNDGGLPTDGTNMAFERIVEWNATRSQPIKVIRGDAYNAQFMQNEMLPEILKFMEEKLPALDSALISNVVPGLETRAENLCKTLAEIRAELKRHMNHFPSIEGANAIADKATEIMNTLMSGLNIMMETFSDSIKSDSRTSESISSLANEAKFLLLQRYDESNVQNMTAVKNSIQASQSAIPYANREIHAIRILIGEAFSKLEDVHFGQLADVRKAVAEEFKKLLPSLFPAEVSLEGVYAVFADSGCCPEITDAVKSLLKLDAPFYNIVYPDIRKEVFDSMRDIERNFLRMPDRTPEEEAVIVLRELRNTGENWIWKTERMLRVNSRIADIVCAAIERFQDRIVRNAVSRRELVDFLERNWSQIMSGGNSFITDIRGRIANLVK